MVTALTTQSLQPVIAVAIVGTLAFAAVAALVFRARRGGSPAQPITAGLVACVLGLAGCTATEATSQAPEASDTGAARSSDDGSAAPVALDDAARVTPRFFPPQFDLEQPPAELPALEMTSDSGVQPGTVLFTTFTTPRMTEGMTFHPSFLVEVDKESGGIVKAQRMLTNATMFQPEPDGRYSYNIVDVDGRDGAGFEVTHYVTDDRLEPIAKYDLDELEGGDADLHDFELLDNGNALLMAYRERQVDLTEFGGAADGLVYDTVLAERTPDGETVWLWDGAEHMDLGDVPAAVAEAQFTVQPPLVADYAHPNSFDVFDDGDVLVSIRHYDCLYRIDRDTGDIVWTFGGPNCVDNEFQISGDPHDGFSHQHDATILDNGNILLFDNGNLREDPVSRVVEYAIDEDARTAELVWSYDDGRYTAIMGSAERLANGNTLIGWGALPDRVITEVTPGGDEVFSLSVPPGQLVYRAYQGADS